MASGGTEPQASGGTEPQASRGTETPEVKEVRGIFISSIGKKMKNAENIIAHLAKKAGIEEGELIVEHFKPRSDTEKGECVLTAKEGVIDEIEKIHFHNWEVQYGQVELSNLIKCSGQIHTQPVDVIITYPNVTPSPLVKLFSALAKNLLTEQVSG